MTEGWGRQTRSQTLSSASIIYQKRGWRPKRQFYVRPSGTCLRHPPKAALALHDPSRKRGGKELTSLLPMDVIGEREVLFSAQEITDLEIMLLLGVEKKR